MQQLNLLKLPQRNTLNIKYTKLNTELQQRVKINPDVVSEYASLLSEGVQFPPIIIFEADDKGSDRLYLIDGFHRLEAAKQAGIEKIPYILETGTYREAILKSLSVNAFHGLRRSNADKRKIVMTLLQDEEWSQWSNNAIAKQCGVSHQFVNNLRKSILQPLQDKKRKVERGGKTYIQDTTNIGNKKTPESLPPLAEDKAIVPESRKPQIEDNDVQDFEENNNIDDVPISKEVKLYSDNNINSSTELPEVDSSKITTSPKPSKRNKGKIRLINPLSIGERVKVKSHHYFCNQEGEVTQIATSSTVILAFDDNQRHLFRLDELDLPPSKSQPIRTDGLPSKPVKKEIYLTEGCNYKAGNPGYGCSWYVKVEEMTYKGLQILQKRFGGITMDAAIARFLEKEKILIPDPTNLVPFFLSDE